MNDFLNSIPELSHTAQAIGFIVASVIVLGATLFFASKRGL